MPAWYIASPGWSLCCSSICSASTFAWWVHSVSHLSESPLKWIFSVAFRISKVIPAYSEDLYNVLMFKFLQEVAFFFSDVRGTSSDLFLDNLLLGMDLPWGPLHCHSACQSLCTLHRSLLHLASHKSWTQILPLIDHRQSQYSLILCGLLLSPPAWFKE